MALLAPRSLSGCVSTRIQRPTQRPCVVVRSASAPSATQTTQAPASPAQSSVVSLSSDEYDEFLAANELVLVDYYTGESLQRLRGALATECTRIAAHRALN